MTHWHAFAYSGNQRPKDSEARDPRSPTPPNEIAMWFRKPPEMRAATFTAPEPAADWLAKELAERPPPPTAAPAARLVARARADLARGADAYVGYYTVSQFHVRALLVCPRPGERCPDPV